VRTQLPELPSKEVLGDLAKEAAGEERVPPELIEKDFYLTRLLWALGQELEENVLLKGGTLLSKVDLQFLRMSQDIDLVLPGMASKFRAGNVRRMRGVGSVLSRTATMVGVSLNQPAGSIRESGRYSLWNLTYESVFPTPSIAVEVNIRPVLAPTRRVLLRQLLVDPRAGDYREASCHALAADEARAEKVRAAFTRKEIRDFYDLERLLDAKADFTSASFVALVDQKLSETNAPPLNRQPRSFGLDAAGMRRLRQAIETDLNAVLRTDAPAFDLGRMLGRFDLLWAK